MALTEQQFNDLVNAITKLAHGTIETETATGFEALVTALSGRDIEGRDSFPRQVHDGLSLVAGSIDNLADAIRDVGRKLG